MVADTFAQHLKIGPLLLPAGLLEGKRALRPAETCLGYRTKSTLAFDDYRPECSLGNVVRWLHSGNTQKGIEGDAIFLKASGKSAEAIVPFFEQVDESLLSHIINARHFPSVSVSLSILVRRHSSLYRRRPPLAISATGSWESFLAALERWARQLCLNSAGQEE